MLTRLSVRNVVLIKSLDLEFSEGLTVLTGETGAGKSILLDSLGLALGSRADFSLIGKDNDRAQVSASFTIPKAHPVTAILSEAGIDCANEIILRRQLRDGKSPALINDIAVSTQLLRQVGDSLVEIQGQFEGRGLLDVTTHRTLLDRFADATLLAEDTRSAFETWRNIQKQLQTTTDDLKKARNEEEWLRDAVAQLDDLAPQENEEESLDEERLILSNVNKIADLLNQVDAGLTGDAGVAEIIATLGKAIDRNAQNASTLLSPLGEALARIDAELEDAIRNMSDIRNKLEGDPRRLALIEDRLHDLRSQARKHNVEVTDLPKLHENLAQKLAGLDGQSNDLEALITAEADAAKTYTKNANALSQRRQIAAQTLDQKVMTELPALKLEQAQFITRIETLPNDKWGPHGIDHVRFEASTNPGIKTGPIDRIASGGELARFLLALKVVLADTSAPMTLIFDEVDSGVGGAVAAAVGDRLARLGDEMQSLVITHSPQVASRGRFHLKIAKSQTQGGSISEAEPLTNDKRIEEISRMLAGATITPEARAAALRLMEGK